MNSIRERDKAVIWHPYTQMKRWPEAIGIVRGEGVYLIDENGKRYIDAISSWWVNLHGHAHPYIAEKLGQQLQELEHCIFAGFTHEPAVQLAERLLPILPGNMARIFYSDNGSTAVEVALKMAYQYQQQKGNGKTKFIALEGAYHGDTFGAMSISGRSLFTDCFAPLLFDTAFIPFPEKTKEQDTLNRLEVLLQAGDAAALILEPLVQGSAGMRMYAPDILEKMIALAKQYGCLVIADEVMTGFGRTGTLFACDQLEESKPDIVCLSKGLTGGTVPLGITACSQEIFDAFLSDDAHKTLYHGHSFTANPIACMAGLASLDLLLDEKCRENIQRISTAHSRRVATWQTHARVKDIRRCGTILAIELETGTDTGYLNGQRDFIYRFFLERNILMRPLGNIIYVLPPYCITTEQLDEIYQQIESLLNTI
jgi:adenosylmethionine-8-amino-7-oxononanoate aminotransferase